MIAAAARVAGIALLGLALAVFSDVFLTANNLLNVLRQASLTFLVGSGVTLVILTAGLDLSIGANVGLSACLAAAVMKTSGSIALGVAAGLACGTAIGVMNGLMVTLLRLPPFIATYGMLWMLHGATYWYMSGQTIYGFPQVSVDRQRVCWGVPAVYLMVVACRRSIFVRYTMAMDLCDRRQCQAARLSGVLRAAEPGLHAERRDGRARGAGLSGASQFG